MVGPIYEKDKDGNIISIDFGPKREILENKNGTKIETSYHLLPNCHDDEAHIGRKYVNFFQKKKYYNKNGKIIKEERRINPNVEKPSKEQLDFFNKISKEDEELRKEGKIYYNPIIM